MYTRFATRTSSPPALPNFPSLDFDGIDWNALPAVDDSITRWPQPAATAPSSSVMPNTPVSPMVPITPVISTQPTPVIPPQRAGSSARTTLTAGDQKAIEMVLQIREQVRRVAQWAADTEAQQHNLSSMLREIRQVQLHLSDAILRAERMAEILADMRR